MLFIGKVRKLSLFLLLDCESQALTKKQEDVLKELISSCEIEAIADLTPFGFDVKQALINKRENQIILIAGDVYSYKTFSRLFDPILCTELPPIKHQRYPFSFDASKASVECTLSSFIVRSVHFHVSRSLSEYRFLPACQLDDRKSIERALLRSFTYLPTRYRGSYFPLSTRYGGTIELLSSPFYIISLRSTPWQGSLAPYILPMNQTRKLSTRRTSLCQLGPEELSSRPDSDLFVQTGINKSWPDARGIYVSKNRKTCFTVNRDCHLGIYHTKEGGDVSEGFKEFCEMYRGIARGLQRRNLHFAYDLKYGFVTWDASRVGGSLTVAAKIRVPYLEKHEKFPALLRDCSFRCRKLEDSEGCIEVSLCGDFGQRAIDTIDIMSYGLKRIVELEKKMKRGLLIDLDLPSDYSRRKAVKDLKLIFGCKAEDSEVD